MLVGASTRYCCGTVANMLQRKSSLAGGRESIGVGGRGSVGADGSWGSTLASASEEKNNTFSTPCVMNTIELMISWKDRNFAT